MPRIPEERKRLVLNTLVARATRDAIEKLQQDTGESQGLIVDRAIALLAHGEEIEPRARREQEAKRLEPPEEPSRDEIKQTARAWGVLGPHATGRDFDDFADRAVTERPVVDNRPKNCRCVHCGGRFAGPKWSSICGECKSSGHTNQPAECPRCNEGTGI